MPKLDRVVCSSSKFPDNQPWETTLIDLSYEEYVARDRDGAATRHVEEYWSYLARKEHENE